MFYKMPNWKLKQDFWNYGVLKTWKILSSFYLYFPHFLCHAITACPNLQKIPNVVIVHGESGGSLEMLKVCNKLGHLCFLPCYDVPCFGFHVSLFLSMSRLPNIKFYNMFRQGSLQDGCCISHLFRYRMVLTIQRRCYLFIKQEFGSLFILQTWFM